MSRSSTTTATTTGPTAAMARPTWMATRGGSASGFGMQSSLDSTFAALADPTRKAVIGLLSRGPRRAGDLADDLDQSPAAMSRHLRVLRRSGLIAPEGVEDDARVRMYRLRRE